MNREQWIEDILQTSRQIMPVGVNPFMATRVEAALLKDGEAASPARLPLRWLWLSVACLAGLIVLNVLSWDRPQTSASGGIQSVMQEYGWTGNHYDSGDF